MLKKEAKGFLMSGYVFADAAPGRHHQDTAKFLSKATKEIYNADDASAADRISRRKFYNDRDEGGGAFRR